VADLRLDNLRGEVRERMEPFLKEMLSGYEENIHSIHITGSSLTDDFDTRVSDTNSVVVLREMDLRFLEVIAPMGKKYGKKKVAAPLIMTPGYVENSRDVFPIEFLNIKLVHETVYGEDIFGNMEIHLPDLRHQCEREIKVKLIGLRQGYIASAGDKKAILEGFVSSITGYIPLFRGVIYLTGKEPPILNVDVLRTLNEVTGFDCSIFGKILKEKKHREKLGIDELNRMFEDYYKTTEQLGKYVNEISG
jgi:hypothetical protein